MKKEQMTVVTVDDVDQETPAEERSVKLLGKQYVIDLSDQHYEELNSLLDRVNQFPLREASADEDQITAKPLRGVRNAGPRKSVRKSAKSKKNGRKNGHSNADIRTWAREQGIEVAERGIIPKSVVERYLSETHAKAS